MKISISMKIYVRLNSVLAILSAIGVFYLKEAYHHKDFQLQTHDSLL